MTELAFAKQQAELRELAAAPDVAPEVLVDKIWPVVNGAIDHSEESVQLLGDTKPLVDRLVSHPDLALDPSGLIHSSYFSANMLHGNWEMLSAYAHDEPITTALRAETCRNIGGLISNVTYGNFNLGQMESRNAQRVSQAAALQLLQRNTKHSRAIGLPSDPIHHNPGEDKAGTTFNIHAWSPPLGDFVPLAVETRVHDEMYSAPRFRDVLLVGLGELAYSAAGPFFSIREQARRDGASLNDAKRWLLNHAVRMLAVESGAEGSAEPTEVSIEEKKWLNAMTTRLYTYVKDYRPPVE